MEEVVYDGLSDHDDDPDNYEEQKNLKAFAPAIYDNSHVLEKLIQDVTEQKHKLLKENQELKQQLEEFETTYESDVVVENEWTEENTATVKKWQRDIEHTSFIYGDVWHRVKKKLIYIMVAALVLSAMNTLFGVLSIALSFLDQKWISVGFQIFVGISNALSTILLGLIPIFSLEQKLEDYMKFIEKLDSVWFIFEIELNISPNQRIRASDFIKRMDGQYLSLMQHCPNLDPEQYYQADYNYKERLTENYERAEKLIQKKLG